MVRQVLVVSILMIIHGVMLAVMGLYLAVAGPTFLSAFGQAMQAQQNVPEKDKAAVASMGSIGAGVLIVLGVVVLLVGLLHIVGGIRCLRFRGRVLALLALFANILPLFTCYCAPTSIAMTVYGLIVLFNGDVAKAFAMGAQGATPDDIKRAFEPGHDASPRDGFDDRQPPA